MTHRIGNYLFSNLDCYKGGKRLKIIRCGGSNGYKLDGRFRSLNWINEKKKPIIEVYFCKLETAPF